MDESNTVENETMQVDITKIVSTQKRLTFKGFLFYLRHLAIIGFICWIMFDNIKTVEYNHVSMIFFALIGLTSLMSIGFSIDKLIKLSKETVKDIHNITNE